jgi:putative tryptophan/tyrosine transport system substrate-binding protein
MTTRRMFIALLGGAAAWPLRADAQSASPVIGFLSSTAARGYERFVDAFFRGLGEQGYAEGRNVSVEYRWADGEYGRLPALAADLIRLRSDVIVAIAPPAARAAKAATSSIPIVFSANGDPVTLGLVSSLNRPGGNLTGVNFLLFATGTKRLDLATKVVTGADTIGLLANPNNPSTARSTADAQAAAAALGKRLVVAAAGTTVEIEAGFQQFVQQKAGAISVEPDPFLLARREQIVALAASHLLPAIYPHREYADVGGLISYGTSLTEAYRQMGIYTGRILKGERPSDLPIVQATTFELVVNQKTASSLGLTIAPDVLTLADEVIE